MNMNNMNMSGGMNMGLGAGGMTTSASGMNMGPGAGSMSTGAGGMNMNHMHMGSGGMNMDMPMPNNGSMDMGMAMYFHTGNMEYILFEDLHTHNDFGFAWACILIFFFAMFYEVLKFLREYATIQHNLRVAQIMLHGSQEEKAAEQSVRGRLFSRIHLLQTGLHAVQIFLSYCLMLIFMTYNVWLCLSLILGATAGYFITGWKRSQIQDQNEHCH